MSYITINKLERLTKATDEQISSYCSDGDKILTDAYGINTATNNLVSYRKYLIPKTEVSPAFENHTYALDEKTYKEYALKYTWINVAHFNATIILRHISDFGVCQSNLKYYPLDKLNKLDEEFYAEDTYAHEDNCAITKNGTYILDGDSVDVYGYHDPMHKDECAITWSDHYDAYLLDEEVIYPEDDPDTAYHCDCVYMHDGTAYTTEEAAFEGRIRDYHCTPDGNHYLKEDPKDILSQFTIGFEVEKCSINGYSECGDPVDEEALFVGWETDSSCGVEGITHVYGLNNLDEFTNHVNSSSYVDEEASSRCGGHINICDHTSTIKYWHIKSWCGLWWAMYRKRLRNDYSGANKKVCPYESRGGQRYQAIREKTFIGNKQLFELRLPNRVRNGEQLIRRFQLSQTWMRCVHAFATEDWTYSTKRYTDVVKGVPDWAYDNNNEAVKAHLKATTNLMADVPPHIFNRMRFLIEESKEPLLESYADQPLGLLTVIRLTYAFQVFIETERYSPLTDSINNAINQYL